MNLPQSFIANIEHAFGGEGKSFLADLPSLIEDAAQKWGLTEIRAVENLSYNFVAFATRGDAEVVLKIGVPNRELRSEIAALSLFDGDGCARLLDFDDGKSMFLLERLCPGEMLVTLEDDDERTRIAAEIMLKLWRTPPEDSAFIQLTDWFDGLNNIRPMFGGAGPFPEKLLARVEATLPRLFAESAPPRLIHGDFHHFNVLSSERGWIAIDPKGVIGPPEYEVGPLLINPWNDFLNGTSPKVQTERRLSILAEGLGFPRQRLLDWATCFAILSSWWDTKPDGSGGEYSLRCAELFSCL